MSAKESLYKAMTTAASTVARHQVLAGLGAAGAIWAGASWAYVARRSTQTPLFRCTRATAADATNTSGTHYDVVIVGAAIAGTVGAMQLAKQGRHVLVVERNLDRPETIIGELLQPGGLEVLERVGLRHCATEVGVRAHGYAACLDGRWTDLPFEDGVEGVSFHHGDFVMRLRSEMRAWNEKNAGATGSITVVEGTVTQLLYGPQASSTADRIVGIAYSRKGADVKAPAERAMAPLTVLCDGGGSNFKSRPPVHSRFFGFVLRDITLEFEERGNVILGRHGIILAYRLDAHEVRFLIDYGKGGAPPSQAEVQRWLREDIRPDIPERYRAAYDAAILGEVRSMPHHHFTPLFPSARGVVGIGDHGNQRHPLTGAGMTCAMRDAVALAEALAPIGDLSDAARVHGAVQRFLCQRPGHSSVMNVLSWALYGVFTGPLSIRRACMAYFREGGDAVRVPLRFLSGLDSSMRGLVYHYMLTVIAGAKTVIAGEKGQRSMVTFATFFVNPVRIVTTLHLAAYAAVLMTSVSVVEFGNPWRLLDRTTWAPTIRAALKQ